ncbi:MAG: hypothetical protein KDD14_19665 [Saprospiraceae bacterium]|nr:hypothetical protein [Saprospiraceae bacterium]
MPCCSNKPPRVRLIRKALFRVLPVWNDNARCTGSAQRQVQWRFFRNGVLVFSSAFGAPDSTLAIGTGSSNLLLNASDAQLTAFLVEQEIPVNEGDQICVQVHIRNCQNEYATSNKVCFAATEVSTEACNCEFVTAFDTGQTGNTAIPPGGYSANGGELVFANGLMNPEGADFSAMPLTVDDLLAWITLDAACAGSLDIAEVTGISGDVPVPVDFAGLSASDFLVFRNGACQRAFSISGGSLTPATAPSEPSDRWHFVRLANTPEGCTLRRLTITASGNGTMFNLPTGYSAANPNKWLLFVNELLQYPTVNYTVSGNQIMLTQVASGDSVWITAIV